MSVIKAEYRYTFYDTDGSTVLSPATGAAHSDALQVTTEAGGAVGWKPYASAPDGHFGRLDPLTMRTTVGEWTFELQDAKVDSDNLVRWISAFLGDARGVKQWRGHKVLCERRLTTDGVAGSWTAYFTARIKSASKPNWGSTGPCYRFIVQSFRADEVRNVFDGLPHNSITYCYPTALLPIGLQDRGLWQSGTASNDGWRGLPIVPRAKGNIRGDASYASIEVSDEQYAGLDKIRLRLTSALAASLDRIIAPDDDYQAYCLDARVRVKRLDTSAEGDFRITLTGVPGSHSELGYDGKGQSPLFVYKDHGTVTTFGIKALPVGHTNYMALPPVDTAVEFFIYHCGPAAPDRPYMIDDVAAGTFWRDLLDAYFSKLDDNGDRERDAIPYDSTAFDAIIADTTIPKVSLLVDGISELLEFVEKHLGLPRRLSSRLTGAGEVQPFDARVPTDPDTIATTIASGDYIEDKQQGPVWEHGRDAISSVLVSAVVPKQDAERLNAELHLPETQYDVPVHGLYTDDQTQPFIFPSDHLSVYDLQTLQIDASSLVPVIGTGEKLVGQQIQQVSREPLAMFGAGASYLTLPCPPGSSNADQVYGEWVKVDIDPQPDPASNQLGGTRVMLVLERTDNRDGSRTLELIDAGSSTVAVAPTGGALAVSATVPHHAVTQALTVNASSEIVEVWAAITATSVGTIPDEDAAEWRLATTATATGTVTLTNLPSGMRIWTRMRSRPAGKLASAWDYPTGDGYADTTALTAPSGLAKTVSGQSVILTWTNGETDYGIMVTRDGVNLLATPLPAGTTRYVVEGSTASTAFTFGVKHVDDFGGASSLTTIAATTSTAATLNAPDSLQVLQGRGSTSRASVIDESRRIGFGLEIKWRGTEPTALTHIQAATDSGFATIVRDFSVSAGRRKAIILLPDIDAEYYVRVASSLPGYTESSWSSTVSAYATTLIPTVESDTFAAGWAFVSAESDGTLKLNVGSDDSDADRFYYELDRNAASYPTVTEADSFLTRSQFWPTPYAATITVDGSNLIGADEIKLVGRFWNAITGFGQQVIHAFSRVGPKPPTLQWSSLSQSGTTGSATLTVGDPDKVVTAVTFRTKIGAAALSSFVSTWDSSTGTAGTSTTLVRTESLTIGSKHGSAIQAKVTFSIGGVSQEISIEHYFDFNNTANVTSISISFDGSDNIVVTAIGDEDTANIYVTATGDGSTPADPTSGSNDGTIAARTGTVTTAITCAASATAKVKARGYNSGPTAGPVFGPVSALNPGTGGGSTVSRIENFSASIGAAGTACSLGNYGTNKVTFSCDAPAGSKVTVEEYVSGSYWRDVLTNDTTLSRTNYTFDLDYYKGAGGSTTDYQYRLILEESDGTTIIDTSTSVILSRTLDNFCP